jgi:isocitrate dehydrogenase
MKPEANIIKLPNISASIPQLKAAIKELQAQGLQRPGLPGQRRDTDAEKEIRARYGKVLGSAVNPVLREGNSDRRAAGAGEAVRPQATRTRWARGAPDSKSRRRPHDGRRLLRLARSRPPSRRRPTRASSSSPTTARSRCSKAKIPLHGRRGHRRCSVMSAQGAARLLRRADRRREDGGRAVLAAPQGHDDEGLRSRSSSAMRSRVFFADVFDKHADDVQARSASTPTTASATCSTKIETLPDAEKAAIEADIAGRLRRSGPALAMVDSDKGITNLHVPSDVIVDASMPAMIRESGKMWGPDGKLHDTMAVIPDRCYADAVPGDHRRLQDSTAPSIPTTMGSRAQRRPDGAAGRGIRLARQDLRDRRGRHGARRRPSDGTVLIEQTVETGDIFRMCQVKDAPIQRLGRSSPCAAPALTSTPAVFWLDENRAHDAQLIAKVETYLEGPRHQRPRHPASWRPVDAMQLLARAHPPGPGHHLGHRQRAARLPDRPVPDPGARHQRPRCSRSCRCWTAAACSRPAPAARRPSMSQQFLEESYLRWDSLGEFLALARLARAPRHRPPATQDAKVLAETLDEANGKFLEYNRSPARKVGEHRQPRQPLLPGALLGPGAGRARQQDADLPARFKPLAETLAANEAKIDAELIAAQGKPRGHRRLLPARQRQDLGGDAAERDAERGPRQPVTTPARMAASPEAAMIRRHARDTPRRNSVLLHTCAPGPIWPASTGMAA